MALQTTRMQGIRQRDTNRTAVADQQLSNQFAQPVRSVQQKGERLQQGQRETRLGLLQRPDNVRVGRRLENREPIISWKGAANRAHAGDRNAYGQQDAGEERRFGPQGLTFDEAERVEKFKQQQIRDMAERALAERKEEFGRQERIGRFQMERERDQFDRGRLTSLDRAREEDRHFGRELTLEDREMRKEDRDLSIQDRTRRISFEDEAREFTREGREINRGILQSERDRSNKRWELEEAQINEALKMARDPSSRPTGPITEGREGYFAAHARRAGVPNEMLYDEDGKLSVMGSEFLQTVDEFAKNGGDINEIIQAAFEHVGFDQQRQADISRRLESDDNAVKAQARRERDQLARMRAERERAAVNERYGQGGAQEGGDAPDFTREEVETILPSLKQALSSDNQRDFQAAVTDLEPLYRSGALDEATLAEIHDTLTAKGISVYGGSAGAAGTREIMRFLGLRGTGQLRTIESQIVRQMGVSMEEAREIKARATEIISKSSALSLELKNHGTARIIQGSPEVRRLRLIQEAARKTGVEL